MIKINKYEICFCIVCIFLVIIIIFMSLHFNWKSSISFISFPSAGPSPSHVKARETLDRNLEVREDYGFTILIIFAESNGKNRIKQNETNLGHQLYSLGDYSVFQTFSAGAKILFFLAGGKFFKLSLLWGRTLFKLFN